jgi:hypothetical protein
LDALHGAGSPPAANRRRPAVNLEATEVFSVKRACGSAGQRRRRESSRCSLSF